MRVSWLAVACLAAACASAPIEPADQQDLAAADALVRQGCYDCLRQANDIYTRVAVGKARRLVALRLFETNLLLALREKEIGLDPAASMARARAATDALPAVMDPDRYLADVEAVPDRSAGMPHADQQAFVRAHRDFGRAVDAELAWIAAGPLTPVVATYLELSLDCVYRPRPGLINGDASPLETSITPDAAPLLRYRAATCTEIRGDALERVRAEVPAFIETSYFLGEVAVARLSLGGGSTARTLVNDVVTRFSDSPAVAYLDATFQQTVGNCARALAEYDAVLAARPRHEDAWLGRTVCLTYLGRTADAIDAATRMIDLQLDNRRDAFYWRATNRRTDHALDLARADVEAARKLGPSVMVLTLAGIIEHDQDDLDPAERDLRAAEQRSGGALCVVSWYLGSVHARRERWREAGQTFEKASGCYGREGDVRDRTLSSLEADEALDAEYRSSQSASLRSQIAEDRSQEAVAALNAANFLSAVGDFAHVDALLETAAREADLAGDLATVRGLVADRRRAAAGRALVTQ
jgi:tetratricopeptide (TPR) repeat protein